MALLPGYRYVAVGEVVPKGARCDWGAGSSEATGWGRPAECANFYMVPIPKPRRTKPYTPPETSLQAYESQ